MKTVTLMAVTLFTAISVSADSKPPLMTFEQLDTNGDSYISQKEAKANKDLSANWKSADENKDGKLDSGEFISYQGRNRFVPPDDMIDKGIGAAPVQ